MAMVSVDTQIHALKCHLRELYAMPTPTIRLDMREYLEEDFFEAKLCVLHEYWTNDWVIGTDIAFGRKGRQYVVEDLEGTAIVITGDIHEAMNYFVALETPVGCLARFPRKCKDKCKENSPETKLKQPQNL